MKNLLRNLLWSMLLLAASPVFAQNFNLQLRSSLEYPGQTLANICGYAQGGREYALLGASKGMVVVDVTDPANPVNIVQIPGPEGPPNNGSLWKEIKVYQHYAYLTTEAGGGLQIIDLGNLPSPNLNYHSYTGDGEIAGQLDDIHALHIDTKKGFAYLYGGTLFGGAAKVVDLNADPYNPTYAGKFDALGYVHDGYADNDTLYACHIYTGLLSIVDMSNKSAPVLLGTVQTPGKFTHNAWLTDDHKHILTTDEETPSFVTSYDISNPDDIKELDRCSTNDGNNSIGHNTHVLNDWAVTSWYTDGVAIIDAHRPENLVITGLYDTWAASGPGFDGCWGVYPFLPSGTVVVSNIPVDNNSAVGKLFVLTPTYLRACYLEGSVKNGCTGLAMSDAKIEVNSGNQWVNTVTGNDGKFKTGQTQSGNYVVTISKPGFTSQTFNVNFVPGEVIELNVILQSPTAYSVTGTVVDAVTQAPIANAPVVLINPEITYNLQTNGSGQFSVDCAVGGEYQAVTNAWGYLPGQVNFNANGSVKIELEKGYYDDFAFNLGWNATSAGASAGLWTRGEPNGTTNQGEFANPDFDVPADAGDQCYVTGNGGGNAGFDDVDNGSVTLSCPIMKLAGYDDAVLTFWYWFYNGGGQGNPPPTPNDHFEVRVTNGNQTITVLTENIPESEWRFSGDIHLKDYITLNDNVRVQFITADDDPGHLVEAAVDVFKVVPGDVLGTQSDIDAVAFLQATPNPSATDFTIRYDWPKAQNLTLEVRNALGQTVHTQQLGANNGTAVCGNNWPKGVYFATLRGSGSQSAPIRLVKQ
ncbi:MAG TPA: choice-of-anchor B family protein [Saprospiraceae bacterium]|nr:choice-of-anchor B family protein [Saprospiraceae bacterium]